MSNGQSIDAMLGIINNANQTATIVDSQRNIADSLRAANERNLGAVMNTVNTDNQRTNQLMSMHNEFANQNLSTLGSSLKDMIQSTASIQLSATERNGAAGINATDRVGSMLSHSLERVGGNNINATERTGALAVNTTERVGGNISSLLSQNNNILNNAIKEASVTTERNFGETRLFNSTQNQNLERRIGDYYLQAERNFHGLNNDLLKVENSLGRLADNHHNASMIELLKVQSSLDKAIDRNELNLTRQASDNYAAIQIEAAKNRLGLEQKMTELGNDIKITLLKDNNDTRSLINSFNNDNLRNDLQSEKIIHALHHHHPHHHHGYHHDYHHGHHRHHDRDHHNHYYPPFFPYFTPTPFFSGGVGGNGGNGGQGGSPRN
jgi:hypothetical protein